MDPLRADVFLTSCRSYELACDVQTGGPGQNCTAATLMFTPITKPGPARGSPLAAATAGGGQRTHLTGKGSDGGGRTGSKDLLKTDLTFRDLRRFKVRLRFWGGFLGHIPRRFISDAPAVS